MAESIKNKAYKGVLWTAVERISSDFASFAIGIVLARLLTPSDYGTIGMLQVFMSFSKTFIDCGFTTALIRKKERSEVDLSTAFWCNLSISTMCYLILFAGAGLIANFYQMPILKPLMRTLGLVLIITSFYSIQITRLTSLVNFMPQAKVTAVKILLGGSVGIFCAYRGCGPWSIVAYTLVSEVVAVILYYWLTKWHPKWMFSSASFRELFGFGSKILIASLLHSAYSELSSLIIGRKYSSAALGFYARGNGVSSLPIGIYTSIFSRVIYPVLAKVQDDEVQLRRVYTKYLRLITSIVVPTMLIFAGLMQPFIRVLIGDQWIPAVPLAMVLCFALMFDPIDRVNLNVLYVKGRSDILLKLEFVKKIIAITIVLVSVQYGVIWLCVGRLAYALIAVSINSMAGGRFLKMSVFSQFKEVLPSYFMAAILFGTVYGMSHMIENKYVSLFATGIISLVLYVVLVWMLRMEIWQEGLLVAKPLLKRLMKR